MGTIDSIASNWANPARRTSSEIAVLNDSTATSLTTTGAGGSAAALRTRSASSERRK